jgi:pyrimidine operon attenuation protein/uracil phosphoribosyltransferase
MDAGAIQRAVSRMAAEIVEKYPGGTDLVLVGIQRGGVLLANRLADELERILPAGIPVGELDVTLHRDDLEKNVAPLIFPTVIPFDITGKTVVLLDDVLFRGRTTRAALDALNDFGRPQRVRLAVLIDRRGHRELPIKADFFGRKLNTEATERVEVRFTEEGGEDAVYLETP